jgi:hypothetical protein
MNDIPDTGLKRHLPAKSAGRLMIAVLLMLGTFGAAADAQPRRDDHPGDRRFDHHDDRGYDHRGYYPAPPVVYGAPVYSPPPVVYGPAVGVYLPGVSIGIQ